MTRRTSDLWAIAVLAAAVLAVTLAFTFLGSVESTEPTFIDPVRVPIVSDADALVQEPRILRTRGEIDGQSVGFELQLLPGWTTNRHELGSSLPSISATWGPIALLRSGPESDGLLRVLEGRLMQSSSTRRFREVVVVQAMSFSGGPEAILSKPANFKLFLGQEGSKSYAELFLQIDLARGYVEISEKDLAYREAILRELSE
jgi:hypothetical protein